MSIRPASTPPVAHWPFVLGDVLCFAVATIALIFGESPPGIGTMLIVFVSVAIGVWLFVTPYLKDHEARVRIAEAQVRDHIEAQIRRLTQTTEQLGNAISRSQSTEEQAGQALGTIEELTERLNTQAEELTQTLARSHEREITTLKAEVERLGHERDDRLAAIDQRLDTVTGQLSEHQLTAKKTSAAAHKTLEEVKERMIALAARLDEIAVNGRSPVVSPPAAAPASIAPAPSEPAPVAAAIPSVHEDAPPPEARPAAARHDHAVAVASDASTVMTVTAAPSPPAPTKTRTRRAPEAPVPAQAPSRISAKPQPLDLPLLDLSEARPTVHRDASGGTSTLVATAYIGIGNKLYVRGDGPGLSWNQGVPMQFLAIGKWGWTSPEAGEPITCRIYRNDETPMLDENVVIEPGSKAEITPRF